MAGTVRRPAYPTDGTGGTGSGVDQVARDAAAAAQSTATAAVSTGPELATALLLPEPVAALDYRAPVSVLDQRFGNAARDCTQPGTAITVTAGSPTGTLGSAVAGLKAGHTACIDGVGNLVVQSVAGTTVTFTGNAPVGGSAKKFIYGTDCTGAFNTFFAACAAGAPGIVPSGLYLITGTVGILEPGDGTGLQGLRVDFGGAGVNTMRLATMGKSGGTTLVWGGAAGGTMLQFARVSFVFISGGLALVGQPSHDPSGVFTPFLNRAGLGLHLSQNGTPLVGTGYMSVGDIVFGEMDQGIQFGTNAADNNCDTSLVNRAVFWRCSNGISIKNTQGLSYRFNWVHGVGVTGSVLKTVNGGAVEIGSLHLSLCGTASGTPNADTYLVDLQSSSAGYIFKIGLLRIENTTVRVIAVREKATHLQVGLFEEANGASTDKTLFYLKGGTLQLFGGRVGSFKSAGETTFLLENDSNAKQPRLLLQDVDLPTPGDWSKMFTFSGNCVADVSIVYPRDDNNVGHETRHTRLERGRVVIGGATVDGTTAIRLDPMMRLGGTAYVYSLSPRVPKGLCVVNMVLIGDHAANTPSVFKRRFTVYRDNAGVVTVVNAETIGVDIVQGTDQLFSFGVDATQFTCNLQVKGTASTTVNWRAGLVMEVMYAPIPDY